MMNGAIATKATSMNNSSDNKEISPEYYVLNTMFASMYLVEAQDHLKDTNAYKQALRNKGNTFFKECERYVTEELPTIWGVKDDSMYRIMDYYRNMAHKLACIRPEDIGVVEALLDKYIENPEAILGMLEIRLVDDISSLENVTHE